jgi:hypothetical protein
LREPPGLRVEDCVDPGDIPEGRPLPRFVGAMALPTTFDLPLKGETTFIKTVSGGIGAGIGFTHGSEPPINVRVPEPQLCVGPRSNLYVHGDMVEHGALVIAQDRLPLGLRSWVLEWSGHA